jgi:type VI protein secretion system component VasK
MANETNTPADAINDPPPGKAPSAAKIADVGVPTPEPLRQLAEDLPENDPVQVAYKDAMLADSAQDEAKAKAKAVDESPNASETPSGAALKAVGDVKNDAERGEKYLREKTARRWGTVPVD